MGQSLPTTIKITCWAIKCSSIARPIKLESPRVVPSHWYLLKALQVVFSQQELIGGALLGHGASEKRVLLWYYSRSLFACFFFFSLKERIPSIGSMSASQLCYAMSTFQKIFIKIWYSQYVNLKCTTWWFLSSSFACFTYIVYCTVCNHCSDQNRERSKALLFLFPASSFLSFLKPAFKPVFSQNRRH